MADISPEKLQEEADTEDIPDNEAESKGEEQGECVPLPAHIPTEEKAED